MLKITKDTLDGLKTKIKNLIEEQFDCFLLTLEGQQIVDFYNTKLSTFETTTKAFIELSHVTEGGWILTIPAIKLVSNVLRIPHEVIEDGLNNEMYIKWLRKACNHLYNQIKQNEHKDYEFIIRQPFTVNIYKDLATMDIECKIYIRLAQVPIIHGKSEAEVLELINNTPLTKCTSLKEEAKK